MVLTVILSLRLRTKCRLDIVSQDYGALYLVFYYLFIFLQELMFCVFGIIVKPNLFGCLLNIC